MASTFTVHNWISVCKLADVIHYTVLFTVGDDETECSFIYLVRCSVVDMLSLENCQVHYVKSVRVKGTHNMHL